MVLVKIYGIRDKLGAIRLTLSDMVHMSLVDAFGIPEEDKFQRFFWLERDDFVYPAGHSEHYTIIEILIFEGRSDRAKKELINLIYERTAACGLTANDLEIVLIESPRVNWGINGLPADELKLPYRVDI
ncbi:tautomerase family protein [Cohnella fermenti]|uniref:Tautomerase family protein n=1 Tax=Cohnella fermenti TaxID=2565925 RepID=A0A4S4C004_9BACL|nr:tautomerase family protein [Cohnella fermenti]THF78810.1 tautomerase family protein [Cohnella fermenti]